MNLDWPSTPEHIAAWSQFLVIWMIANYAAGSDPTSKNNRESHHTLRWSFLVGSRSLVLGFLIAWLMKPLNAAVILAAVAFVGAIVLPVGRTLFVMRDIKWVAEWEIILNAIVLAGAALIIGHTGLAGSPAALFPLSPGQLATVWVAAAAFVFAGRGATHVVRGILDKVGTVPKTRDEKQGIESRDGVDTQEYNRGRVIGVLERWLLIAIVMLGTYAALGLLVAAKGLVRIKELEDRDFSEYFLIGTLTSVLLALVLGLLVHATVTSWW